MDDILSKIERCAVAVFPADAAALKRYRLNDIREDIREYIAQMHHPGGNDILDPTVEAIVSDPVLPVLQRGAVVGSL